MRTGGSWRLPESGVSLESPALAEGIDAGQLAGAVDGVQAEDSRGAVGQDALDLPLAVFVRCQAQHAVDRKAGAVSRHADLRRPVERAVAHEERTGRPRAARVGFHRVARVR